MTLPDLGWNDGFATSLAALGADHLRPARVVRQDRQRYVVRDAAGVYGAVLLGRLLHDAAADRPAVGDWVAVQPFDDDEVIIHAVLSRQSAFSRKRVGALTAEQVLVANIDTVFLVTGLDGDFNLRRIERYVVQSASSGAQPVLLLNKADLCEDVAAQVAEVQRVAPGYDVIPLSAERDPVRDKLAPYLQPGQTVAFLGSSGVGKSTLINRLLGADHLATGAVRADDSRGRHTTTHRELIVLPDGGIVIDAPGLRELQLWGDEAHLEAAFADIEALAEGCRFRDCSHQGEPGCAIEAALDTGDLDVDRFHSYLKLRRELRYLDQRKQEVGWTDEKQRNKQFGKLIKAINRHNPKRHERHR